MGRSRYVVGWALVVALAVGVTLASLVLVRSAVGGGNVVASLSPQDVSAQYAEARSSAAASATASSAADARAASPTPAALPEPTAGSAPVLPGPATGHSPPGGSHSGRSGPSSSPDPRPTSSPSTVTRVLTSPGGSVVVRCTFSGGPGAVYLVSWSPAQGYSVDHAQRGPGEEAEIEFESGSGSVSVNYHCSASGPVQSVETGDDWSDGGDDGGVGGGDR